MAALWVVLACPLGAQTWQSVFTFGTSNGFAPNSLIPGNDGNFYGTTQGGGAGGGGTVFRISADGVFTVLAAGSEATGISPNTLAWGADGRLYGVSAGGGTDNSGTVFQLAPDGSLIRVYSFAAGHGVNPNTLVLGSNGNLFGTTAAGGASGDGAMFQMTTNGDVMTLLSFFKTVGSQPNSLVAAADGSFYGTTATGGMGGYGTVFRASTNGTLTLLASFFRTNGANPNNLIRGGDGSLYGTTAGGGPAGGGTVFRVTTNGNLSLLAAFSPTNILGNGWAPNCLAAGEDGACYGVTAGGGAGGRGTLFQVTSNGTLTTLFDFSMATSQAPNRLIGAGNGQFYGTTAGGGNDAGGIFRFSLPPILIIRQPQSVTNHAGGTVTFAVSATSAAPLAFHWQKEGNWLGNGGRIAGADTAVLTISGVADADLGAYHVVLQNSLGNATSADVVLGVDHAPYFTHEPVSQVVSAGTNVTLTATAVGAAPLVFQWFFNGQPLGTPMVGGTNVSWKLLNAPTNAGGNYQVQVVNAFGGVLSSNAVLQVVAPPVISLQPASRVNKSGTTAAFSVVAAGVGPVTYQWQKGGTNLLNGGRVIGATSSTFAIVNSGPDDSGWYGVVVRNAGGAIVSSNAQLIVMDPPRITAQPKGMQAVAGAAASLGVSVSGSGPMTAQWRCNGISFPGATNLLLEFPGVSPTNAGTYSFFVANRVGSDTSSNVLLTVWMPAKLTWARVDGWPRLSLEGQVGSNYFVQYSPDLRGGNWSGLTTISNLATSPYLFNDTAGFSQPARFYRALTQ